MDARSLISGLAIAFVSGSLPAAEPDAHLDVQGTWTMTAYYYDGQRVKYPPLEYTFLRDEIEVRDEEQRHWWGTWKGKERKIYITAMTRDGMKFKWNCIYEIRDGKLRLCYSVNRRDWPSKVEVAKGLCLLELDR